MSFTPFTFLTLSFSAAPLSFKATPRRSPTQGSKTASVQQKMAMVTAPLDGQWRQAEAGVSILLAFKMSVLQYHCFCPGEGDRVILEERTGLIKVLTHFTTEISARGHPSLWLGTFEHIHFAPNAAPTLSYSPNLLKTFFHSPFPRDSSSGTEDLLPGPVRIGNDSESVSASVGFRDVLRRAYRKSPELLEDI
ncbi:hypothetical protein B0H16DRAFT_1724411 [Mycena metata]|uniref:Uncharacterized protein n=1 Tax=Mycena metata TaxID=1033252 RepID=A0AAD7N9G8_9AGAR|nr:hypothetical protein B0H16DRAFT_1724411 [Mycena metata]